MSVSTRNSSRLRLQRGIPISYYIGKKYFYYLYVYHVRTDWKSIKNTIDKLLTKSWNKQ